MFALLGSVLVGLLLVHFLEGEGSGAIVALVSTLFATALASLVDVTRLLIGAVLGVPVFLLSNPLYVSRLLGICCLAVAVHEFSTEVLELMDLFFRRVLSPSVHFLYSMSFLFRVGYEPLAVGWNVYTAVTKTAVYGSLGLVTKCSIDLFVDMVRGVLEILMLGARSFFGWLGGGAGGSILTNDFDFVPVFEGVQTLLRSSVEVFDCACNQVGNLYRVPVSLFTPPAAARAVHHYLNVPIALVQELLDTLRFESFPHLKRTFYHLSAATHEAGRWVDQALLNAASTLLHDVLKLDEILPEDRPAKFVGSFFAALAQAALQTVYLAVRAGIHFALPLKLSDAAYVFSVLSPREIAGTWLREAVNSGTLSAYWLLEWGFSRATGLPAPAPRLDCSFTPAFYGDRFFQSLFCAVRTLGRAATTTLAVVSTLPVEFTVMTLLAGGERNGWQVLQRYDGALRFTDPFVSSCELRKAVAAPEGWDLSTEASSCHCYDEDAAFLVPEYDKDVWSSLTGDRSVSCAQPQLQDVFRDLRDASEHVANVATPFLAPIIRVYGHSFAQVWGTGVRLGFSLADILNGDFFELPISGTGAYGAREDLALLKWESERGAIVQDDCAEGFMRETALTNEDGSHPCLERRDVLRLHYARARRYTAAELCRRTNSGSGLCRCNPALPMEADSSCTCNIVFADDSTTHSDSYAEARWRHQSFRERGWCGTQIMEPLFKAAEDEVGDAVLSLVDGLYPGSVDFCGAAEYQIVETDISTFTESEFEETFLPDRDKWSVSELRGEVEERVLRRQAQRAAAGLPTLTSVEEADLTLEETRHVVKEELGGRALANATSKCYDAEDDSTARASCLLTKAHDRSATLARWRDSQCSLYGHDNVVCSANAVVQHGVGVWVGVSRQIWNSGLALVTGHPNAAKYDWGNRLCDAQRFFAAQASTLAAFLPVRLAAKKAIAKFLFFLLEVQVESSYLLNQAVIMVDDLVRGLFLKDTTADRAVHGFVENVVMSVFKYWAHVLEAMGDLIEAYEKGGGKLLYTMRDVVHLVGFGVRDILLDTVLVYTELLANAMRVFSGDSSRIPDLIRCLTVAFGHMKTLLPRIAMQTMSVVLQSLGPVGEFLASLAGSLCFTIEQTMNAISIAINTITVGAAGMEEDNDFGCLKQNFYGADADDDAVNATLRQRSMQELPLAIAELGWEGNSFCDGVVRGYADMTWGRLRALERETLLSCLRQRHLGVKIAQQFGILSLQSVPYDWSERVKAVYRLSRTLFAYLEGLSPQNIRTFLTDVEYKEYLPAVRRLSVSASTLFTPERVGSLLQTGLTQIAEIVRDTGDTGARLTRVVGAWSNVTTRAAQYWAENNGTAHAQRTWERWGRATSTSSDARPRRRSLGAQGAQVPRRRSLFAHPVFADAGRKLRVVSDAGKSLAKDANTYLLGAAGVSSDTDPCDSAFSVVCLRCKILDNILETLVEELVRAALFFRYTYAEITLTLFMGHVRGRALALRNGLVAGAKDMFSNVEVPRPENVAAQFDRMTRAAGANAAYAAVELAKSSGNALGVLETAAATTGARAFNRTSPTTESLETLNARADAYALGADEDTRETSFARRPVSAPTQIADEMTFEQRKQFDWEFLWENFPYVPSYSVVESPRGSVYIQDIETISIVRATAIYLSTTEDTYCPLYGHGLFYSLSRPLLSTCDMDNVIYSRATTQSERMELYDEALWLVLFAFVAVFGVQYYVGLPLLALVAPVSLTVLWYVFTHKVYGFSYNCVPSVPVMLGADVSAYINRWHPEPLCMRYSALAESCDPHADLAFHNRTAWKNCFDDPAVSELGYLYSLVYYVRTLLPDVYDYFRQVQPWRYWLSGLKVLDLLDENTPLRENCARLLFLDAAGVVALSGTLVWLFFTLVVPPVIAVARAAVQIAVQISGLANLMFISITRVEKVY